MSDAMAIGAIRALRDRGLSIPADVSVVGFDDIELAGTTDPPLTTIHQPIRGKGEQAVRLLLDLIAGNGQPPEHRRLATQLIVRASTAVAPTSQGR
jgi:LacI family repressor for deo operon, udp, cdd, tsx, nupC, and nupG